MLGRGDGGGTTGRADSACSDAELEGAIAYPRLVPTPQFITRLREQVGPELLWLPGATAVILDGAERVLLVRRADNGLWALVSGIVEPGEDPAACLVREAFEETGVAIEVQALVYLDVSPPITYPNGDQAQYLDTTFLCRHVGGSPRVADDESTAVAWFPLASQPDDMSATSRDRLARALEYRADPGPGARFRRPE